MGPENRVIWGFFRGSLGPTGEETDSLPAAKPKLILSKDTSRDLETQSLPARGAQKCPLGRSMTLAQILMRVNPRSAPYTNASTEPPNACPSDEPAAPAVTRTGDAFPLPSQRHFPYIDANIPFPA
jgi:hypothetical protein